MSEIWTVRRAVLWTADYLASKGADAPRTDADVLLADVLGVDRVRLLIDFDKPLAKEELASFRARIERRAAGEPLAYIRGRREFYGRRFDVDARVLVPRPETEGLVEHVLAALPDAPARALDLCAGSGCIGLTLAAERPQLDVTLVELDPGASEVATANATRLGVEARATVRVGDLFEGLSPAPRFEVIVSNPPYVPTGELPGLPREVLREPALALDGGGDGLSVIRRIARDAATYLAPSGLIALEIAIDEGEAVARLLLDAGLREVRVEQDYTRRDRYVLARAP